MAIVKSAFHGPSGLGNNFHAHYEEAPTEYPDIFGYISKGMNMTDKMRILYATLFVIGCLTALIGWIFFEKDPNQMLGLLSILLGAVGVGEASAVGKRATVKPELMGK